MGDNEIKKLMIQRSSLKSKLIIEGAIIGIITGIVIVTSVDYPFIGRDYFSVNGFFSILRI
ncbi:MAG: hypothetical protein ACRC57_03545 [Sarcina sp.]